jgi:hypothetical protein
MAFSVGGLLLGLINEIRINLPLSQELIDRIDAALGPEEYRTGLIRDAVAGKDNGGLPSRPMRALMRRDVA